MDFTFKDMVTLLSLVSILVVMTMVFPAVGFIDEGETNLSTFEDLPELDVTMSNVEVVGERPLRPRTPTSGELRYNVERHYQWEDLLLDESDYESRLQTFTFNNNPINEDTIVQLVIFNETSQMDIDIYTISESDFIEGNSTILEVTDNDNEKWRVRIDFIQASGWETMNLDYVVRWNTIESPEDSGGFFRNLPLVGSIPIIWDLTDEVAQVLSDLTTLFGWFITMLFWFAVWIVDLFINFILLLINLVLFFFALIFFILNMQATLILGLTGLPQVIMFLINLLVYFYLGKFIFLFIKTAPTT